MTGLTRLTDFIAFLRERSIAFSLQSTRPGFIMVMVPLPGGRYEVEFSEDRDEWAIFTGNEDCHEDFDELYARLEDHSR